MNTTRHVLQALLLVATLCALGRSARGQDGAATPDAPLPKAAVDASEGVRALRAALLEVEALAAELRAVESAALAEPHVALASLEAQVAERRALVLELRTELEGVRAARDSERARRAELHAELGALCERGSTLADRLAERAQGGIPTVRERVATLAALGAKLKTFEASADAALDAFAELLHTTGAWLPLARTSELTNHTVAVEDRTLHAWVLRLGVVGEAFLTEDGTLAGLASRDPGAPWETFERAERPLLFAQLESLAELLRGASAARLAPVPSALFPTAP